MANILGKLMSYLGLDAGVAFIVAIVGLSLFASIGGFYVKGRFDGYAIAQAEMVQEMQRQSKVNQEAQAKLRAELDAMAVANEALDQEMEKLREEADRDPGAARCGIGPNSVQRLNRL
jgi:hypothetical protein